MKTKLLLVLLSASAFATGAATVAAQTAPAATTAPAYTIKFTPSVVSQYMFRGVRLGDACFQPALEVGVGDLALGIWASTPFNSDKVPGVSDPEIDPYGSYTLKISDAASFVPGFTWYNYPDADKSAGFYKSTFEPSLAFNYTAEGFTLTPKIYYDIVLKGATVEFTAAYAVPLKEIGSEFDFSATIGSYKWSEAAENTAPDVKNWGDYWSVNGAMPFEITKSSKLTVGLGYAKGTNNFFKQGTAGKSRNSAAIGRMVISAALAVTF
jgi:uncharacterized protein (TIGR02001 family)